MQGVQACDIHSYAHKMQELRKDFEKMKTAKSETEVDEHLEKYEQFIEFTYTEIPWTRNIININNPNQSLCYR